MTLLLDTWQFLIQGETIQRKGKDKDIDKDKSKNKYKDKEKNKDKVIMWLLLGSCNLTLLPDTWQFLIPGKEKLNTKTKTRRG